MGELLTMIKKLSIIFSLLLLILIFPINIHAKQITNTDATYLNDVMTWKQIPAETQYNYVVSYATDINSYLGTSENIHYMSSDDFYYLTAYGYTTPTHDIYLNVDILRNENVGASAYIFVLAHEIRHVWQFKTGAPLSETDSDMFAMAYLGTLTY